jgi:uncharacterized protein (TIGR03435 family)
MRVMQRMVRAAVLLATGWAVYAQPAPRPSFEVASIKPSPKNCTGPGPGAGPTPGRIELPCVSVRLLIRAAYGLLSGGQLAARYVEVLGGPAWLDSDRYTITAKAEGPAKPVEMLGPMLQTLLEDRFQLKLHREPREHAVYVLTVAKGGPKLRPAKESKCPAVDLNDFSAWRDQGSTPCGMPRMSRKQGLTVVEFAAATMQEFASRAIFLDRPVVDKTGLAGRYDIHLEFAREFPAGSMRRNGMEQPNPGPAESPGPTVFTALREQLGLKLAADKAPVDVIVIDSVQRPTPD